jgi:hypothetical protein
MPEFHRTTFLARQQRALGPDDRAVRQAADRRTFRYIGCPCKLLPLQRSELPPGTQGTTTGSRGKGTDSGVLHEHGLSRPIEVTVAAFWSPDTGRGAKRGLQGEAHIPYVGGYISKQQSRGFLIVR